MSELDRYQLLANAIAARPVPLLLSRTDAQPFTDGESITIPLAWVAEQERCALAVVAQATLLASDSLHPALMRRLVGRPAAQQRYLMLEALRARMLWEHLLPWRFTSHREWPTDVAVPSSAEESMEMALQARALPSAPTFYGVLQPLAVLKRTLGTEGVMALLRSRRAQQGSLDSNDTNTGEDGEESKLLKLFAKPWGTRGVLSQLLESIFGRGRSKTPADEGGAPEELFGAKVERMGRGVQTDVVDTSEASPVTDEMPVATEFVYPEWNFATKRYRKEWVLAATTPPARVEGPRDLASVLSTSLSSELRRRLATLGLTYELHGRQRDGTDLDLSPLIETAIDHATGHANDAPRVYRAARRTRRDLSVCIVLDVSGSTGEGQTAQNNQFDQQLQVAWHLGEAFDSLGDTVEMFGFHSWGRTVVRWLPLKSYEERWSNAVRERFAQLEPAGFTRLGAAVRHAHHRLATAMRLPFRLMLIVSDGVPYDQEYEGEYARADVRQALAEANAAGIACLCICVGADPDLEKLHTVFDPRQLIVIDRPEALPARIVSDCRRALALVSKRRTSRAA
jgi:hypothetical protein